MRKNIIIVVLATLFVITAIWLAYSSWWCVLWRMEATRNAAFAAALWADNDYSKGKIVKLRLTIEAEPKPYVEKSPEFDGPYVIHEWVGYSTGGGSNSPSIQSARLIVDTYNKKMTDKVQNPERYKAERAEEIEYWQQNVLNKKEVPDKAVKKTGETPR